MINDTGAVLACFLATLLAMAALRPVAVAVELVDKPGGRKTHKGEIPVVGGLAMFLGIVFGLGLLPGNQLITAPLMSAAALVVLVGLLDDRFEISAFARLAAHLIAAVLVLSTSSELRIATLGRPFGSELIEFSAFGSAAFTCVAIMGAINAFNMLDGMDGLAGTMAIVALGALFFAGLSIGDGGLVSVSAVAGAAVVAFLVFNVPAKFNRGFRCFMGDAGSTLLGFLLACMCISASQGIGPRLSPTVTLWFVAIPLYELLWTTSRRILRGQSPVRPDRAHFHHKLLDAGFGVRGAFMVLVILGSILAAAGMLMRHLEVPDSYLFSSWLMTGVLVVIFMHNASILWHLLPNRLRREPRPLELEST